MKSAEYIAKAKKTESVNYDEIAERLSHKSLMRVLHSALGLSTEAGEILDAVKKHVYYGKELDKVNLLKRWVTFFGT